jgi:4-amino-4-deoxy-L-arabinose transferase-like glycosyltransferase
VFFEARLRRFGVWRVMVGVVAVAALAAVAAWTVAMFDAQTSSGAVLVVGLAALLMLATIALSLSLLRNQGGLLACREGVWMFAADGGPVHSGPLVVAIDLGGFLLLRLGDGSRPGIWLPVQRLGLQREWHALRCAVYSPPPVAGASPRRLHPTSE